MMNGIDALHSYAIRLAQEQASPGMVMTIEKELLHYSILDAMDEAGLLDHLVFQGGTSLRLCYGAERYSEDLDFSGGRGFDRTGLDRLKDCVEHAVGDRYDVTVDVKEPRTAAGLVSAWTVIVDTTPRRKDIPRQRIKIEVASIDAHDPVARPLMVNYAELGGFSDVMLMVESREEILADKIESFVCSSHVRYRDLWDLAWLSRQPGIRQDKVGELRRMKALDYGELDRYAQRYPLVQDRLADAFESDGFAREMERFLPASRIARTIERPLWMHGTRELLAGLFASHTPELPTTGSHRGLPATDDAPLLPMPDPTHPSLDPNAPAPGMGMA